jgi:excinuclease ABC subunit A
LLRLLEREKDITELFQQIAKQGLKVRVNGDVLDITAGMKLDRYKTHDIEIVDRMVIENTPDKKASESINTAMHHGKMY